MTWTVQYPGGAAGGRRLAQRIRREIPPGARVLIVVRDTSDDLEFARALANELSTSGYRVEQDWVRGQPADARRAIDVYSQAGERVDAIAATDVTGAWPIFDDLPALGAAVSGARVLTPPGYGYPNFLKLANLLNIANQIAFIAIMAIGMTMVIIAGGIDLSVGSLVALSAVIAARLIRDVAGGVNASPAGLVLSCLAAVGVGGLAGGLGRVFVAFISISAF